MSGIDVSGAELAADAGRARAAELKGLLLGLIGVAAFALTLPATRAAVAALDPVFVGFGRAIVAAALAAVFLVAGRHRLPTRAEARALVVVALGVVVGFPLLSALAMRSVDASHGGVMLGLLPLATAASGALLSRERPSRAFWLSAAAGGALVVALSLVSGDGALRLADLALLGAVASAAIGYAEGARIARSLGSLQVISWALVFAAPFLLVPTMLAAPPGLAAPAASWIGFAYVSLVSQYLAFLAWYGGMALGGIARVSQTQLLQPFLTIFAGWLLLGEAIGAATLAFAAAVLAVVALGARTRVARGL